MKRWFATPGQRGMALYMGIDLVVFLAIFFGYVHIRAQATAWPSEFHFASGLIAVAMTFFTVAGSVTMFYAAEHQSKQSYEIAMRLVVATLAVWASVVILMGMEWVRLLFIMDIGFMQNAFSITYFTLTGLYLLHILVGLVYQSAVAARIRRADVGAAALYTYATNLIWLIVFVGVYLASTDLQGL